MNVAILVAVLAWFAVLAVAHIVNYGTYAVPRLDLGEAIHEYRKQAGDFIGLQMLATLGVRKKKATISRVLRESLLRRADVKRAKNGSYNRDDFDVEDVEYACVENGLEGKLSDDDRKNYASDFDAELETSQITELRVLKEQEIVIATLLFNTTTWTGSDLYTDNKAAPWSTAGSDAIGQVLAAAEKVRQFTGLEPDTLCIGKAAWDNLKLNTAVIARITGVAIVTQDVLTKYIAGILGVTRILVGKGVYNSAAEGGTLVIADIWDAKYAMLAVTASGNRIVEPCVGRSLLWTEDSPENVTVEEYREEQTRSDIFRVRQHTDEKILDAYFAHLMRIET